MIKSTGKHPIAQGDVLLIPIARNEVPEGLREAKDLIVGHSETGHHHVAEPPKRIKAKTARLETDSELVHYLLSDAPYIDIVHKRGFDTHETVRLPAGPDRAWLVKNAREYIPGGQRRVQD